MKAFLSKYWKRILIIIGIVLILINIVNKIMAPKMMVEEFAEYGPEVQATVIGTNASKVLDNVSSKSPFSEEITKYAIIGIGVFVLILIISDLANKKPATKKK